MNRFFFLFSLPLLLSASELRLQKEALDQIGLKVWQNECGGTVERLIFWNPAEEFPSLGIGHFIWYPQGQAGLYDEGFPKLVEFLTIQLKDSDIKIPSWIKSNRGFPWKSREAFLKDQRSSKMMELRDFLSRTLDLQVCFLFERFKVAEKEIFPLLNSNQRGYLEVLKCDPRGIYALIDYVNFKGFGCSDRERYRGQGWGLLQVLQNMPDEVPVEKTVEFFTLSAKQMLSRRVNNAPPSRNEKRFLKGWFKRLETYTKP